MAVTDPEAAAAMLHHILHDRLRLDPAEHPLMLTEPAWNTAKSREVLAEMAFEGEKSPAMYFGSSGVLSAYVLSLALISANEGRFAAGKPTALILDVGHYNSSAVPVVDGYALRAGTMRQPLGSSLLLSQLHSHFTHPTPSRAFPLTLAPRQLLAKRDPVTDPGTQPRPILRDDRAPHTTQSWRLWAESRVLEDWKESCGEIVNYRGFDYTTARELPQALYEFPDGYSQYFGEERYRFTEMLFDPARYFNQVPSPTHLEYKLMDLVDRTTGSLADSHNNTFFSIFERLGRAESIGAR